MGKDVRTNNVLKLLKSTLDASADLSKFEKTAIQRILPWLVFMGFCILDNEAPDYQQGAPSRVFRLMEEEGLINSQSRVINFFTCAATNDTGGEKDAVVCTLIAAFICTALFEKNWHEQFSARYAEEGGKMQGLFLLAPLVR